MEQTSTGYEVALRFGNTDQYTVWSTDSGGNYTANVIGAVSSTSIALETFEASFQQDLNGDGVISGPAVIESFGSTSLVEIGNNFYLNNISSGTGPTLKYANVAFVAGQFGAWTPIGVEQTSTGYEVALRFGSTDQYTVWSTDSSGNYTANVIGAVSRTSIALESFETSFQQDLNGDGVISPPAVIEAFGSTSLVELGNNFYLDNIGSGTGPELKFAGVGFVAGQFGAWTPIGVEQTSTGYEIALNFAGTDQYTLWSTDSSGNYTANLIGAVSGTNNALTSAEIVLYQDLNQDGFIGTSTTVVEASGSAVLSVGPLAQAAMVDASASLELTGADNQHGHVRRCHRYADHRSFLGVHGSHSRPDWNRQHREFGYH